MAKRGSSASDFTPYTPDKADRNVSDGQPDSTYPLLGDLHCSEEQKQAAAEVIHSHIRALPPEEQDMAWEDIAGALGVDEYRPI